MILLYWYWYWCLVLYGTRWSALVSVFALLRCDEDMAGNKSPRGMDLAGNKDVLTRGSQCFHASIGVGVYRCKYV